MIQNGTLLLVDDDSDDQEMITLALQDIGFRHEIVFFNNAESALNYLYAEKKKPFLIVSDINMPKIDGLAFKEVIEECPTLSAQRIPFVFLSTAASANYLRRAYQLRAQGFFQKGSTFENLKASLRTILQYWSECMQPSVN
jgi:CheY-like chemotaxis protein